MYYTGAVALERISPDIIVLDPPEKLIIETSASGEYRQFEWSRNGTQLSLSQDEFSNFHEIYVRQPTTTDDLGVYEADLPPTAGQTNVQFFVTRYSKHHKTSITSHNIRYLEHGYKELRHLATGTCKLHDLKSQSCTALMHNTHKSYIFM